MKVLGGPNRRICDNIIKIVGIKVSRSFFNSLCIYLNIYIYTIEMIHLFCAVNVSFSDVDFYAARINLLVLSNISRQEILLKSLLNQVDQIFPSINPMITPRILRFVPGDKWFGISCVL